MVPAASFTTRLLRRWRTSAGVMLALFALVGALPELLDPDCRTALPRLVFLALVGPVLTLALTLLHDRAARGRAGAPVGLAPRLVVAIVLGALLSVSAWALAATAGITIVARADGEPLTAARALAFGAFAGTIQFVIWALAVVYPFTLEDARARELEANAHRLEVERLRHESEELRASAELAGLRARLEPHFLLNTLNAIAGLVTQRPREARRLLACLGDLLRDALRDPEEMQPLGRELEWLQRYAQILESRHEGALAFRWEIDDRAKTALVPRLLLQPLVENAVHHGALQRASGGEVTIRVTRASPEGAIVCEIEDNGPGLPETERRAGAFGLRSVERRLALKVDGATFRLESSTAGTRSTVRLPEIAA